MQIYIEGLTSNLRACLLKMAWSVMLAPFSASRDSKRGQYTGGGGVC